MAQPKDFLDFITDETGKSFRVNNGMVEAVSTPTPIPVGPDGWQEKSIKYKRNIRYSGLFRTYTNPLKWVKDAALIIRDQLYRKGTETKLYYVSHWLDKSFNGGWVHRFFYRGELDLTQTEDEDNYVETNIMEGDLSKLVNANENTEYELDLNVPEAVTVKMDGLRLKGSRKWIVTDVKLQGTAAAGHFAPIRYVNGELTDVGIIGSSQSPGDTNSYFVRSDTNGQQFNWSGPLKLKVNSFVLLLQVRLIKRLQDNSLVTLTTDTVNPPTPGVVYSFNFNYADYPLNEDEELIISVTCGGNPGTVNQREVEYVETIFTANFNYRYTTTFIKGLRPAYVGQKLLDKLTGGGYTFESNYLSNDWNNLLLTSGDGIRGIDSPKLRISWADFFDSYNVPCNLSSGIRDQKLWVEKKEAAYQSNILLHLGTVRKMKVKPSKDYQYNVLKIGYPDVDTKEVNGRDEFNVTQVYTSPVTRVKKELTLVSKVIASMYEIEKLRIRLDGQDTTDDASDKRSFFLYVEKDATTGADGEPATYHKLYRETYDSLNGLISGDTAFNLPISPKRCLYNHGNELRGYFYWLEGGQLVFQTNDKNADVVTVKGGVTISEKANVVIGSLAPPLFIPLDIRAEGPMPNNTTKVMDEGPDGTISLDYDGATFYGFPMEVGIQPANRPAQETTLLCSPQTDLTKLITYGR
ncbi:hypothetical protein [Paraflavitalea sp. CAU 1676]|uniref:hypothetical protein n=1 Tax=Paraflavitalea sp. CAU 1676 TaxID=3032598 RepID=UPI0023DAA644|nr:hypothetical protein [Paraflavitalea sp. CAU 1676]MDF2189281.1 hypothetical protein [Paraflavitalea sp. CAU 1676]